MRKTLFAPMLAALIGLSVDALIASAQNAPQTTPVSGTFAASPARVKQRTCVGVDGPYLELRGLWSGTVSSTDPRLTGDLEFTAAPALVNLANGFGTFQGRFVISDPVSGKPTSEGEFFSVVTEAGLNHAFASGKVMNQGAGPTAAFLTAIKATLDPALNVQGEFGAAHPDARTPGVIQGGHCDGQFTDVP